MYVVKFGDHYCRFGYASIKHRSVDLVDDPLEASLYCRLADADRQTKLSHCLTNNPQPGKFRIVKIDAVVTETELPGNGTDRGVVRVEDNLTDLD